MRCGTDILDEAQKRRVSVYKLVTFRAKDTSSLKVVATRSGNDSRIRASIFHTDASGNKRTLRLSGPAGAGIDADDFEFFLEQMLPKWQESMGVGATVLMPGAASIIDQVQQLSLHSYFGSAFF